MCLGIIKHTAFVNDYGPDSEHLKFTVVDILLQTYSKGTSLPQKAKWRKHVEGEGKGDEVTC